MSEEHFPYFWAGYRRGCFSHLPDFKGEMSPTDFSKTFASSINHVFSKGGKVFTVVNKIPIGTVYIVPMSVYVEVHVIWLTEATSRLVLQASVEFLTELKRHNPFLIICRESHRTFFDHLCKYGLMRTVGKLRDHYNKGEHAMLFQSV
jgi:hypothetical protein